ncbi:MAG: type II secretion system F family protein [Alphaproteobacteria bacterium]|nr:MAG: type II secretion system F family protein [Alphaproteobacteria bacterium]
MSGSMGFILGVVLLCGLSVMAVAYALLGPALLGGSRADKRVNAITKGTKAGKGKGGKDEGQQRRRAVQETLKQLEQKQKEEKKRKNIRHLIEQTGIALPIRMFWILSSVSGVLFALGMAATGVGPIAMGLGAMIGFFGFPRWVLQHLCKRRQKAFTEEFANALDVIVRGVKSGLPLNECLRIIARESPDPVGKEFRHVVDAQKMGMPIEQSLGQMYERMPIAEVNFFQIVLIIQQSAGGNLSEALGNLSSVLRNRKSMRAKIQAMSSEAKASAMIIGSLPPGVMGMVYLSSPDYISLLFTTSIGHLLLLGSVTWMAIGVFVMRKMINFNF